MDAGRDVKVAVAHPGGRSDDPRILGRDEMVETVCAIGRWLLSSVAGHARENLATGMRESEASSAGEVPVLREGGVTVVVARLRVLPPLSSSLAERAQDELERAQQEKKREEEEDERTQRLDGTRHSLAESVEPLMTPRRR